MKITRGCVTVFDAMALPPIAKATLQAALISAGSNVLAQGITSYRNEVR